MPEGDTIFRSARTLDRALAGRLVTGFRTVLPQLSRIDQDAPLAGRTVEHVRSLGKHLLMEFSGDLILRTHMRMHGSWHLYRPGERWQAAGRDMRIVIATAEFEAVAFRVPVAEFRTQAELARDPALRDLGPDLLADDFDAAAALARLRTLSTMPVADALLVQGALAGIGNVFKSETLFEARVSPFLPVGTIEHATLERIIAVAQRQLRANVGAAADASPVPGRRRTTGRSNPREALWVYGRRGEPCRRCGTAIRMTKQGVDARMTYYCPACQDAAE
jgi:endonuclease-8